MFVLTRKEGMAVILTCALWHGRGANQELKNQDGKSAREVAELNQQEDVVSLFKEHNDAEGGVKGAAEEGAKGTV